MAGKGKRKERKRRRLRAPRWLLPVIVLGAERARVTARLARTTSLDELSRAARSIGYVKPGEHLFIVKGTAEWRRRHAR
jgi:hypothetical protein